MLDIGIRREDKNRWERRAPLTPQHVEELVREHGLSVAVEPSELRVYGDEEYAAAGAEIRRDLADCRVILGVKEVPVEKVLPAKPYLIFSHVIKGQLSNMPLLQRFLDLRSTLLDYEPIVDENGRRLIFFGRHAGYAGMIDALWALGRRLEHEGVANAFGAVSPAHTYRHLPEARDFLARQVAPRIREQRLDEALHPLVVGFTGGGNVSQGAREVLDLLPVVEVDPAELPGLATEERLSRRAVYKVVFRRRHRQDFARFLPYLTVLVNGIYWQPGDPVLASREDLRALWGTGEPPRLRVLADLSCDVDGSIQATVRTGDPGDPVYTFDPLTGEAPSGVTGRGPVVLAVDNLPAELPRDASEHFGDSLFSFASPLARARYGAAFEDLGLPPELRAAVVTHRGELTPRYKHLERSLKAALQETAG